MATITWKGEPLGDDEGPKSCTWYGKVFKKGEAVEVDNPEQIAKAKNNRYFEVSGDEPKAEEPKAAPAAPVAVKPVPKV